VAKELEEIVRRRVGALGLEIVSAGIRDVILPGDMKDLMNKVTEAKKAAEAIRIVRREETAAMRSQANTAKLLEGKCDVDAAGVGGPGEGHRRRQAERRAGREGPGRAGREPALIA
jgi:regulator of protease activity HflC (stomatin/prohibitin superfamily)